VAFSPDGRWLTTGGWDRTIKLWSTSSYDEERLTYFGHTGFVYDMAFSPNSQMLASVGEDRGLRLWEVPTGRTLETFHGHADFVHAVAFRPDGQELATGGLDGNVKVWDLKTSRPVVFDQQEHFRYVYRIAYGNNGQRVLSAAGYGAEKAYYSRKGWNPVTGQNDPELEGEERLDTHNLPAGYAMGAFADLRSAESPDRTLIAQILEFSGGDFFEGRNRSYVGNTVEIRDVATGKVVHTLVGHTAEVTCVLFSPDSRRLATASNDFTIKLWDVATGREVFTLIGHTGGLLSMAYSPDGNRLVSGGIEGISRVWDATPLPGDLLERLETAYIQKARALEDLKDVRDNAERAEILVQNRQWDLAADAFSRAVAKDPGDVNLWYRQILSLLRAKNRGELRRVCGEFLDQFGDATDPNTANVVAWVLVIDGRWSKAAEAFGRLAGQAPPDPSTQVEKIGALREAGDSEEIRRICADLLDRLGGTTDPNIANNLAWACVLAPDAVADPEVPVRLALLAIEKYPQETRWFALNTLGVALYRAGRYEEAITRLNESIVAQGGEGVPQDWAVPGDGTLSPWESRGGPPATRPTPLLRAEESPSLLLERRRRARHRAPRGRGRHLSRASRRSLSGRVFRPRPMRTRPGPRSYRCQKRRIRRKVIARALGIDGFMPGVGMSVRVV
jgi:Flp pilus assembly protein TadD